MGAIRHRHLTIWTVLALAFVVRALVPAGWMPADLAQGSVLMPCPTDPAMGRIFGDASAATASDPHSAHHGHHNAPTADADFNPHDAPPCAFTALASHAPEPPFAQLPQPPLPEGQAAIPVRAPLILERIARERPPSRAPPLPA
ncbi:hypothetical protein [Croceicoccus sp. Ery15]|uniref:hypothetical protein n=1 Tax=Croceicoccus sp. Ery15 TaxID=1703338 RepID=UPI001E3523B0|nr:hypothetical protein [Croceicoccus sp. Ery15]